MATDACTQIDVNRAVMGSLGRLLLRDPVIRVRLQGPHRDPAGGFNILARADVVRLQPDTTVHTYLYRWDDGTETLSDLPVAVHHYETLPADLDGVLIKVTADLAWVRSPWTSRGRARHREEEADRNRRTVEVYERWEQMLMLRIEQAKAETARLCGHLQKVKAARRRQLAGQPRTRWWKRRYARVALDEIGVALDDLAARNSRG